jgi:O-methyltransferase
MFILDKIAKICYSTKKTLDYTYYTALNLYKIEGAFVECGVGAGGQVAAMQLAAEGKREIIAFDSYEGIPLGNEKDYVQPGIGRFTHDPALPLSDRLVSSGVTVHSVEKVKENIQSFELPVDNIRFVKGWFQDTLPITEVGDIALLRLDGDLYESTLICLEYLYPKVVKGGVVIIDDYGLAGCRTATHEYFKGELPVMEDVETKDCHVVAWVK